MVENRPPRIARHLGRVVRALAARLARSLRTGLARHELTKCKPSENDVEKLKHWLECWELSRPVYLRPGVLLGFLTAVAALYGVFWQYSASSVRKEAAELAMARAAEETKIATAAQKAAEEFKQQAERYLGEARTYQRLRKEAREAIANAKEVLLAVRDRVPSDLKGKLDELFDTLGIAEHAISPDLREVFLVNASGWAVGEAGTILATKDAGKTWTKQDSGTWEWLHSVHFVDELTGWVVGEFGLILVTRDAGMTWAMQRQQRGVDDTPLSVHFVNETTGWAVGNSGTILSTTDAGKTWARLQLGGGGRSLNSDYFVNETTGWAVDGRGTIRSTTDAGITWSEQNHNMDLTSVHFVSEKTGWVVGNQGTILSTTDAGKTWTQQVSGTVVDLHSVDFVNETTGWAVGNRGTILSTTDAGKTWTQQRSGTNYWLSSVHFANETTGCAVGGGGIIVHTTDGGQWWDSQIPSF